MRPITDRNEAYVHGYDPREGERLHDQAGTLTDLLHSDTAYPSGSLVLEAGCGVGAQTVALARRSPDARFTSIDISPKSIDAARRKVEDAELANVRFQQAGIFALPFPAQSFDHVFVCFVLEHLPRPAQALLTLKEQLRLGGTITVIEGDHGSTYFHPDSAAAREAIECLVALQRAAGGNALIGRQLYPLMAGAGFAQVQVSPRTVYVDASRPDLVDGFTRKTFTAMIQGVRASAISGGADRTGALRSRNPGSLPHDRGRRRVLLHLFQRHRKQAGRGVRDLPRRAALSCGDQPPIYDISILRPSSGGSCPRSSE